MPLEEDKKQHAMDFDQAINYVNKVKAKDKHVYKAFLHILNMYRARNKTINEVYQEVTLLFENHGDLLEGFTYFLPGSTIPSSHAIAKPRHQQEPGVFGLNEKHVSERHTIVRENEQSRHHESERRAEKSRKVGKIAEKKDLKDRKERNDREGDNGFSKHRPKRVSARNASDAIRRQSQAGEGGEGFAPQVSAAKAAQYPFFDKVKARLCSQDTYPEFLKCLNIFSQEIINCEELQDLVGDILGKHEDLLEGFNEFLTHCENVEGYLAGVPFARTCIPNDTRGDPPESTRKFANKPISMLDLSNCNRCTPSYRLLPKNYPRLVSEHRTAIGNSVLNDNWVSVTSGSEDYSFKYIQKNRYEERLFRCEEDRYELDMLRERTAAAAKVVSEYVLTEQEGEIHALPPLEELLSPIHLRCIERIYEDHELEFLELLKQSTPRAMRVILSRLVQKTEEWTKWGEKMSKVWSEVYRKNVYKALDHRSFCFKQQDKKVLGISLEEAVKAKALDCEGTDGNVNHVATNGSSEGDETSNGGNLGSVVDDAEAVGMERSGAGVLGATNEVVRIVGDFAVAEMAGIDVLEHGSKGAERDVDVGGTAARSEGFGWLHCENSVAKQRSVGSEKDEAEERSVFVGANLVMVGNGSEGCGMVDREEGEMSPVSEHEDQDKVKCSPRRGVEGNGGVEMSL